MSDRFPSWSVKRSMFFLCNLYWLTSEAFAQRLFSATSIWTDRSPRISLLYASPCFIIVTHTCYRLLIETLFDPAILIHYEMEELLCCTANHAIYKLRKPESCFWLLYLFSILFCTILSLKILLTVLSENECTLIAQKELNAWLPGSTVHMGQISIVILVQIKSKQALCKYI